ncbi:hypothetical protein L218DRAFT_867203 [Marasmius fiardii PR-910]|nr:hypothetical protein L218DRAFT_867203 [Marasmius fiardii PR-910]
MSDSSDSHLRRSKRIRKQTEYHEHAEHNEEADDNATSLRFRKERTLAHDKDPKQKATRRKRGFLQRLKELPLDVVFEIFSHLTPHDLLNLSRTSKDLRKLLLSRSTILVWKSARMNVEGLPDIPDDMSEPAYAHLCFDVRCHVRIQRTHLFVLSVTNNV